MPTKRKAVQKKVEAAPVEPAKTQFVTEVVEELPVNEGVDVSEEALATIKESAEKIEEVVEEIQEDLPAGKAGKKEEEVIGPPEDKKEEEKEVLSELFTKETPPTVYPDITEHKRIGAAPVFLWAVIIIGVALLTGGILLVVASSAPKVPSLFAKPTPTPTVTPSPTPKAAARSDISIQVLNGGGTPGSAGKAKTFLEGKGYTVGDTGNTDEYTYKKTEVHVKAGKEAYLEFLKVDLADEYSVSTADASLAADSSYDAQVIVGKE